MTREEKMKIVINNYFKTECSVNTSIREAFEKGFRIGASKVQKKPEVGTDCISRQQAIDDIWTVSPLARLDRKWVDRWLRQLPSAQPKRGKWILDRSGAYCCSECMEPCATYVMMRPRDKFCKMCGSRNEVTE